MESSSDKSRTVGLDPADGGISMPRLLFGLLRQRFTGVMTLEQDGFGPRKVWFRGGMPVFTDWALPDSVLGELLVQSRLVDHETLHQALALLARPEERRLLGQLLVETGKLDRTGLTATLRLQLARKLQDAFALRQGEAALDAVDHQRGKNDDLAQANVLALILGGVATHYDEARIRDEMGASVDGDLVATQAFPRYRGQFGFRDADARIVDALCRGGRIEGGVVRPGVARERALAIVYSLWATQMLRTGDDATRTIAHGGTAASADSTTASKPPPSAVTKPPVEKPPQTPKPAVQAEAPRPAPSPPPKAASNAPPTPSRPPAPAEELDAFERELAEFEAKVAEDANPFLLFGISLDAERKDVRDRWTALSTRFHPDALESRGRSDLRTRVEPVFAALSEAYGVLSNKEEREKIRKIVEAGGTRRSVEDASRLVRNAVESEMIARDGDKLLKNGAYERALEAYERALELSPEDDDARAAALWCRYQLSDRGPARTNETLAALTTVTTNAPKCARGHFWRGMILLSQHNESLAKAAFQAALVADKRFVDAERQLRAIKLKKTSPSAEKKPEAGISASLRGWFTKK